MREFVTKELVAKYIMFLDLNDMGVLFRSSYIDTTHYFIKYYPNCLETSYALTYGP